MIKYHLINTYNNLFNTLNEAQGMRLDFDGEIKEQTNQLSEEIAQGGYSELYVMDKGAAEDLPATLLASPPLPGAAPSLIVHLLKSVRGMLRSFFCPKKYRETLRTCSVSARCLSRSRKRCMYSCTLSW